MKSTLSSVSACTHPDPIWGRLSNAECGIFFHCTACVSDLCPTCGAKVYRRAVKSKIKRAHVVHYVEKANQDSPGCTYTGETSEHAHAKIFLRDRIRDSIPKDSSTNTFTINVSTCQVNAHSVCFTVELKADYSCTVETVLHHDGSRRVGDVVIKDAKEETVYIFEIFKTSRTKNSRPEPWFELEAGDVLKALAVPDGWTSCALECVRFQNNNTNCSRPPCATCATLLHEDREREAQASAARALQRETRDAEDREEKRIQRADLVDEHGHCKNKLGECFSQSCALTCDQPNICGRSLEMCPATGCGGCALLPCARCGGGTPRWLHDIFSSLCSRSCEWDAAESAEHTLAALTLRDKMRALVPLPGTARTASRFGVCVLLCSFHHEQYNHKRFDNFVLRPGFTCDVESDTGAGKSRRVGAVVLKNAEGIVVCAFVISSGATCARPEPWFECDASDALEALSSKDWTMGQLRCVRFETNAPKCRRGRCTQCAAYRIKQTQLKTDQEKEERETERRIKLRISQRFERNQKRKWTVNHD
jgi:hypothetical protein